MSTRAMYAISTRTVDHVTITRLPLTEEEAHLFERYAETLQEAGSPVTVTIRKRLESPTLEGK